MRKKRWGGLASRRGGVLGGLLGLFVFSGVACSAVDTVGDGGVSLDASATATATATSTSTPTGTGTSTSAPDASPSVDGSTTDAETDGGGDASADDASADDASADDASAGDASAGDASAGDASAGDASGDGGGAGPVMPGLDGILRGTVGGNREQSWLGTLRLPNANCPASAQTVNMGAISCCRFTGSFASVSRVPVEFDLTTGTGTLAGAPLGPFGAVVVEGDGTMRFRQPTLLHAQKAWVAGVEMGRHMLAPASEVEESSKLLSLALVRPISDSLRNMQVAWNPTTKVFRITMDLTMYQATPAGTCGLPSGDSSGRLLYDLR